MTTTMFKRPKSLSRSSKQVSGGFDRIHNGLISGWFSCTSCGKPPSPSVDLLVNGEITAVEKTSTPRPDVPGGLGFLLRFPPVEQLSPQIRIQCPLHPTQGLEIIPDQGTWSQAALASIETSAWPMVTGWVAILNNSRDLPRLEIDGHEPITVRTTIRRPDVQNFLGFQGVGGFQIDLGTHLGYALPDATLISLTIGDQILATASISGSPLGEDKAVCFVDKIMGSEPLDESTIHALRRRFRDIGIDTSGDWRNTLDRLGQRDYSAETEQWADYLTHHGHTPQQVSAWLALRATHALGVPTLNPLPADLDAAINPADDSLPERARSWTETILGVRDRPTEPDDQSAPESVHAPDQSDMKVAVAGLVHHKSGLGQNAQNSLKALDLAGAIARVSREAGLWGDVDLFYGDEAHWDQLSEQTRPLFRSGVSSSSQAFVAAGHSPIVRPKTLRALYGTLGSALGRRRLATLDIGRIRHIPSILINRDAGEALSSTPCKPDENDVHTSSFGLVVPTIGVSSETGVPRILSLLDSISETANERHELHMVIMCDEGNSMRVVSAIRNHDLRPVVRSLERPTSDFNFSHIVNQGSLETYASALVLLNDDVVLMDECWQDLVAASFGDENVGIVGATLLDPMGNVQHEGVTVRLESGGLPIHSNDGLPSKVEWSSVRPVHAVAEVFMAISRDLFFTVGGLSPEFPEDYGDFDLCWKVQAFGLLSVVIPRAVGVHHESSSRQACFDPGTSDRLSQRWGKQVVVGPLAQPEHCA